MIRGDLHVHTCFSDGSWSLTEAINYACFCNLDYISFTDHDTVEGSAQACLLGKTAGLMVIPGIEISAWDFKRERKAHLLGYGYRQDAPHLRSLCDPLLAARHQNSLRQLDILRKLGYRIDDNRLERVRAGAPILYKQHLMQVLVDTGQADSLNGSVYKCLFKGKGPAAGDIRYVDVFDALEAILADGGLAVLAHPGQLDSWDLAVDLIGHGLGGIEVFHPEHGVSDQEKAKKIVREYKLLATGGTDNHGRYGSSPQLGSIACPPCLLTMPVIH